MMCMMSLVCAPHIRTKLISFMKFLINDVLKLINMIWLNDQAPSSAASVV